MLSFGEWLMFPTLSLCIAIPAMIYQIFMFWKYRESPWIKHRGYGSVMWYCISWLTLSLITTLGMTFRNFPCLPSVTWVFISATGCSFFFAERCLLLYVNYIITAEVKHVGETRFLELRLSNSTSSPSSQRSWLNQWLLKNKKHFSLHNGMFTRTKMIALFGSISTGILAVVKFIVLYPENMNMPSAEPECYHPGLDATQSLIFIILIASMLRIWISILLKPVQDNFEIKIEMKKLAFLSLYHSLFYAIIAFGNQVILTSQPWLFTYTMIVHQCVLFPLLNVYVTAGQMIQRTLRMTKKHSNKSLASTGRPSTLSISTMASTSTGIDMRLEIFLKNDEFLQIFQTFLENEFSVENLLTLRAIDKVFSENVINESSTDDQKSQFVDASVEIMQEFCTDGALLQVNVSTYTNAMVRKTRAEISDAEQGVDSKISDCTETLKKIRAELFNLMLRDSFVRFKFTSEAKQYFEKAVN
jgi:hypothetical protein